MGIESTDILGLTMGEPLLAWLLNSRGPRDTGLLATASDIAWVVGSIIFLVSDALSLTTAGNWDVLIVGDVVLLFAIAQILGLRRMKVKQ